MTVQTSLSGSRFTSGQPDFHATSRVRIGRPVVLANVHGAGGDASGAGGAAGLTSVPPLVQALGRAGFVVVTCTQTNLWGNATSRSRQSDAVTYGRGTLGGSADPVVALGISHGAPCGLLWHANSGPAACAVLIAPAVDLEDIRTNDTMSLRAAIDAAHGVTYPAALPNGVNPAQNTSLYEDLPQQIWYSTTDAVSNGVTTYGTAVGAEMHATGSQAHGDAIIAAVDVAAVVAFIEAHAT